MNADMIKRFGLIALGGIAGGFAGYFLASLVIDQLMKPQEEFEEEEENTANTELRVGTAPESVKEVTKRDYTKFAKSSLADLVKPYTVGEARSKQDNIRIISLDEYDTLLTNKELISYYEGDTTFCDSNEENIPNPEDFFGPNVHLHFGEDSGDPDIVYVRNENNGTSYEITRYKGKYSVIVMGMADEEPKGTKAKRRKSTKTVKETSEEENEGDE